MSIRWFRTDGGLIAPAALAFDGLGRLEVLDPGNEGILRYSANGTFLDTFISDPAHLSAPLFFDTSVPEPGTFWMLACATAFLIGGRAAFGAKGPPSVGLLSNIFIKDPLDSEFPQDLRGDAIKRGAIRQLE